MLPFRSPRGDIVDSRRLTSAAGAAINTMKSPASRTRFLSRLPSVLALALLTVTIKGEKSTVLRSPTHAKCKSCAMPDLREECKPRPQPCRRDRL